MGVLHCKMRAILVLILDFTTAFWTVCVCVFVCGMRQLYRGKWCFNSARRKLCDTFGTVEWMLCNVYSECTFEIYGNNSREIYFWKRWDRMGWLGLDRVMKLECWVWEIKFRKFSVWKYNIIIELIRSSLFSLFSLKLLNIIWIGDNVRTIELLSVSHFLTVRFINLLHPFIQAHTLLCTCTLLSS